MIQQKIPSNFKLIPFSSQTGEGKKDVLKLAGRTDNNRTVNLVGNPRLINTFVDVRITAALPHSLRGEIVIREA